MDYGMIGKIEKAKRYSEQPERITFLSLTVDFTGDNSTYRITLGPEGWDCSCSGFRTHGICPHVMTLEKEFRAMIKRSPLPYAPGQNVVSDVEKAMRYATEPDRLQFKAFEVQFDGDNNPHHTTFHEDHWHCDCSFFESRGVCCHTMAMERILKGMMVVGKVAVVE